MKKLYKTLVLLALFACSSRRDVAGSSFATTGELGAACKTSDDCEPDLACLDEGDLRMCTTKCGAYDGGACPQGSLCVQNVPQNQTPGYCARICSNTRECEDLNPGYNSCEPFGFEAPLCGIHG